MDKNMITIKQEGRDLLFLIICSFFVLQRSDQKPVIHHMTLYIYQWLCVWWYMSLCLCVCVCVFMCMYEC